MNLRDLHYLVALSEHLHFGRAAAACHVTQPTLSTQLRKLEESLGITLIERNPGAVLITEAGRDIVARARSILREIEHMKDAARQHCDPEAGSLRLGLFPTLGPYLLPHAMPRLQARLPRVELLLVEDKSEALLAALRHGTLDAALLALPIDDAQLHLEPLFEEPFVLAVPRGQALESKPQLRLRDLRDQSLLLLEEGHCLRDQALDVCALAGAGERAGFRGTSLETLRQMVGAGVGITLLPQLAVAAPVSMTDSVSLLPFSGQAPSRRIGMLWRRSTPQHATLRKIAEEFARAAEGALAGTRARLEEAASARAAARAEVPAKPGS